MSIQITTTTTKPTEPTAGNDVAEFVAAVRARLVDLPAEDQQDLTEGLEADLTDLVTEQGPGVLTDADAYARELRTAAGFSAETGKVATKRHLGERLDATLDTVHTRWDGLVAGIPGDPAGFLVSLRPAWWVLRAWVAVQLVDLLWGGGEQGLGLSPIPSLGGLGLPALVVAIAVSVQIGRGKLWPAKSRSGAGGRVLLLLLNALAISLVPVTFTSVLTPAKIEAWYPSTGGDFDAGFNQGYAEANGGGKAGVYADGRWISQIYPYDASGKPLVGIQLFDQEGKPVNLETQTECVYDNSGSWVEDQGRVYYPWTNGAAQQKNVIPVPSVIPGADVSDPDPLAFTRKVKPAIGQFPFVSVPEVSLPGLTVSKGVTPKSAYAKGARPQVSINGIDEGC